MDTALAASEIASDRRDRRLAYALLRSLVGINIIMHGVSRMLMGPSVFAEKLTAQFGHSPLPLRGVWAFGMVLPAIEALLGMLLLLGLRTRAALVALLFLMMLLTLGVALVQDWSAAGLQLTYGLVLAALLFLSRYNGWSLDACLKHGKQ